MSYTNPILEVKEGLAEDESIENYQLYQFYPESGTQLNNPGNITITVNNSDNFYHPSRSWLEFEGQLVQKKDDKAYAKDAVIAFVNYGILHLFDLVKYTLNNAPVETVFNPGFVANVMGLATFPNNFKQGLIECWCPDSSTDIATTNDGFKARQEFILASEPTPLGSFRFSIPLKRIFGFADDYGKILYGFNHSIILTRSSTDDNALCHSPWKDPSKHETGEIEQGKIRLDNIRWMLPRVTPSDVAKFALMKDIRDQTVLNCGFRMRQHISMAVPSTNIFTWRLGVRSSPEQPRFVFLAFQTGRAENQNHLNTVYDHCDLSSAHVLLNNDRYPMNDFETSFARNHFDHLYNDFNDFRKKFYGIDPIISSTSVGPLDFKSRYPIYCFDVSKQSERLKSGVTDITLQCRFDKVVKKGTVAHALIISDRKLKFKSDGEKLSVIF